MEVSTDAPTVTLTQEQMSKRLIIERQELIEKLGGKTDDEI